jgi:enoyl-CoA hydratase/3-hydroxyacyl-CoA dehydrogenase
MHFFYHAAKSHLVEIVPGARTSDETVKRLLAAARQMALTPIVVKDSPGFAVNRFFVPLLNECVRIFEEGVANIATIDVAFREAFGTAAGPFQLMNMNGVALAWQTAQSLAERLSPFYAPARTLRGQGQKDTPWPLGGDIMAGQFDAVRDRLYGVVFGLAALIVQEGVAEKEDIETGALKGLRWMRGPFELMESLGMDGAGELVKATAARYNDFRVARVFR